MTDLKIESNQSQRGLIFKIENVGIITVHAVTGCPPPNCEKKVILQT